MKDTPQASACSIVSPRASNGNLPTAARLFELLQNIILQSPERVQISFWWWCVSALLFLPNIVLCGIPSTAIIVHFYSVSVILIKWKDGLVMQNTKCNWHRFYICIQPENWMLNEGLCPHFVQQPRNQAEWGGASCQGGIDEVLSVSCPFWPCWHSWFLCLITPWIDWF